MIDTLKNAAFRKLKKTNSLGSVFRVRTDPLLAAIRGPHWNPIHLWRQRPPATRPFDGHKNQTGIGFFLKLSPVHFFLLFT